MLRRGVDIVIVCRHPGLAQLPCFLRTQFPERDTHFHAQLADIPHNPENLLEPFRPGTHPAPCRSHAEPRAAIGARRLGPRQNVILRHEALGLHSSRIARTLRTVGTVFAAPSRLDAQQCAQLHLVLRPVFLMHPARLLNEGKERLVIETVQFGILHGRLTGDGVGRSEREITGPSAH